MGSVVRGGFWLYLGAIVFSFTGFIYWLAASLFLEPEAIGLAAAIIAAETMLVSFFSFGIGMGLRGLAAKASVDENTNLLSTYVSTALTFSVTVGTVVPIAILLIAAIAGVGVFMPVELIFLCILIVMDSWQVVLYGLFISLLRSEVPVVADISLSVFKLVCGMLFILNGFGVLGLLFGLLAGSLAKALVVTYYCRSLSRQGQIRFRSKPDYKLLLKLLRAGFASWVPNTLMTLGQAVGVLMIYGLVGGTETGAYQIAFAISLLLYRTSDSLQSLMFPVLSGMKDGRKRATIDSMRISLVVSVPLALALFSYAAFPFFFLGQSYSAGSAMLQVLIIGVLVYPIVSAYSVYVYALEYYKHVVAIGTATTVTRLIIYFLLTSSLAGIGISIGYTAGVYVGLAAVILSARRIGVRFREAKFGPVLMISTMVASVVFLIGPPPWIGMPLIAIISIAGIVKLRVVSREEIVEVSTAFMSRESAANLYSRFRPLLKFIFE